MYAYDGQRAEDISFAENEIILAHPAKDVDSPWEYGTLVGSGKKGWFPSSYVESIEHGTYLDIKFTLRSCGSNTVFLLAAQLAKGLYDYTATSSEEISFSEGDELTIVDSTDSSWWKALKGNSNIGLVPATYVELLG